MARKLDEKGWIKSIIDYIPINDSEKDKPKVNSWSQEDDTGKRQNVTLRRPRIDKQKTIKSRGEEVDNNKATPHYIKILDEEANKRRIQDLESKAEEERRRSEAKEERRR